MTIMNTRRGYTPPKGLRAMLNFYDLLALQHGLRARGVSLRGNNRYVPHQGKQECARRVRQAAVAYDRDIRDNERLYRRLGIDRGFGPFPEYEGDIL